MELANSGSAGRLENPEEFARLNLPRGGSEMKQSRPWPGCMYRTREESLCLAPPAVSRRVLVFWKPKAYATGHRGEGRWRLAGSYISTSEMRVKKAGRKLWKKKARKKRQNEVRMGKRRGGDGAKLCLAACRKRAALCPGMFVVGTPRNKKAQARQGLSSLGRRLSWAIFCLAHTLRFAYFHQSLFLVESAWGASYGGFAPRWRLQTLRGSPPLRITPICAWFSCLHSRETDQVFFALDVSFQLPFDFVLTRRPSSCLVICVIESRCPKPLPLRQNGAGLGFLPEAGIPQVRKMLT